MNLRNGTFTCIRSIDVTCHLFLIFWHSCVIYSSDSALKFSVELEVPERLQLIVYGISLKL